MMDPEGQTMSDAGNRGMRLSQPARVWEGRPRTAPRIGRSLFLAVLISGMVALSTPAAIVRAASAHPPMGVAISMPSRATACSRASLYVATVYRAHALGQPSGAAMADAGDHPIHNAPIAAGNATAITDPRDGVTTYQYDPNHNLVRATDANHHTTSYGYDAANERTTTTRADGGVWQTSYDANGNAITRTDPRSNTTTETYDALDRLIATTDALAHTTSYQYDPLGNRTLLTDANAHSTAYQYDTLDRLITTTDALSNTTVYGYDLVGNRTAVTDANNHSTRYGYDAGDEQTTITRTDGTTATTGYDLAGNVITRTSGLGHATTYGYDLLDRPITTTDPLTGTTVYGYDLAGNRISMADPLGRTSVYTYDAADQQTAIGQADGSVLTTAYDLAGNPVTATDALGKQTIYGYDSLNRVITTTDPLGRQTLSGYDLAGNRTSLTDALGRVTTYGYDALNRPSAITYSDGVTPNVRYTYTATGQRRSMTDGTGATTYGYDALDRVITTTTGAGQSLGYGYDAVGNTTAITYPNGFQVTRSYDTLDRLSSVRDWLGHTARFGYDAADNLITQTLPTSTTTTIGMGYDAADRLTGITDTTPITTWTYGYTRDKAGEITAAVDPLDGQAHRYSYDKLAGLTADSQGSSGVTSTVGWANDAAREVTQRLDPSGPYTSTLTYDNAHELTGTTTLSGTTTTHNLAYTYNQNGDRTTQTDSVSGASATFGYDQADRLITAVVSDTSGITTSGYSYDGDGLRQSKVIGTQVLTETWDTSGHLPVLLQDGSTRYVTGPDGLPIEQVISDTRGITLQYILRDQLGSTRALLDGAGNTVATYTYDPYGNVVSHTGSAATPFGFAGQYTDAETGLQYLRARYYDPGTGQFMSVDPLVDETGQPYAYTSGNPLNNTDPTGLFCVPFVTRGGCRLPTWGEARQEGYGTAVSASAVLDSMTFGGFSYVANWAGAGVSTCSVDYQNGEKAALPINMLLAVGSFGGDVAADAAVAGDVASNAANGARLAQQLRREEAASGLLHINQADEAAVTVGQIFKSPDMLKSMTPDQVDALVRNAPGWRVGTLQRGGHAGQGWTLRQIDGDGYIQWHPGGGHHGPNPYWKISSGTVGTIRILQ